MFANTLLSGQTSVTSMPNWGTLAKISTYDDKNYKKKT